MLVFSLTGSSAGKVVDLPPLSARAMLADGRAVLPGSEAASPSAEVPEVTTRVSAREDRGLPRHKRRAVR